ncbi:unnamed protein product [Pedinophyceae sp. YPF-701]|nr:unnamed protein product [Pedinophyceae sp. YPF-701]
MEDDPRLPLVAQPTGGAEDGPHVVPPAVPTKRTLTSVCPFILGNEFCERLAYYGLATNLVVYLTRMMGLDTGDAAFQVNLWGGTCYITPLLGAYLADSVWGRYYTILFFSIIYLVGMLMLSASAFIPALTPSRYDVADPLQLGVLFLSLYIVAVGTGGIKPNVSAFGADQFDHADPQDKRDKESFFNWFYFSVNIGSLIASLVIVYVQEEVSWTIGFAIPAVAMALAVLTFWLGHGRYKHNRPTESPLQRVVRVLHAAWHNRGLDARDVEVVVDKEALARNARGRNLHRTRSHMWLEKAVLRPASRARAAGAPVGERAESFSLRQVEEVKRVMRLLPVFVTMIAYWTMYAQMGSLFVIQGEQMDRRVRVGGLDLKFPAASMSAVDTISIIVLIPIYDQLVLPFLGRIGRKPTQLQRMGAGLVVSVVTMLVAGLVENRRLMAAREGPELSVLWQVPMYLLVGLTEVLTAIGQMEFFYEEAPAVMRSCMMALELLSTALGSYLAGFIIWAVQRLTDDGRGGGWIPRDLNRGRLDLYFVFLAGLVFLNTLVYAYVARRYTRCAKPWRVKVSRQTAAAVEAAREAAPRPAEAMPVQAAAAASSGASKGTMQYAARSPGRPLPPLPPGARAGTSPLAASPIRAAAAAEGYSGAEGGHPAPSPGIDIARRADGRGAHGTPGATGTPGSFIPGSYLNEPEESLYGRSLAFRPDTPKKFTSRFR